VRKRPQLCRSRFEQAAIDPFLEELQIFVIEPWSIGRHVGLFGVSERLPEFAGIGIAREKHGAGTAAFKAP